MIYRKASLKEIETLINIRKRQLVDEGIEPYIDIDKELWQFFCAKLADGSLAEWVAVDNNEIIATAAIIFYQFPPTYTNKSGIKGYITNMYTKNEYRGKGIGTQLLDKLVEEARQRGVTKLWLGASKLGRPVYKKFGFTQSDVWMDMDI